MTTMREFPNVDTEKDLLEFARHLAQERHRDLANERNERLKQNLFYYDFTTISADADIGDKVVTYIDCTSGNVTGTLPDASRVKGQILIVKRIDSSGNTCTVDTNAGNIDGSSSTTLSGLGSIAVQSDGSNYYIILQ